MNSRRPVAPHLWTQGDPPHLIGGCRRDTGKIVFPMPDGEAGAGFDPVELARRGTLWSWTIQSFRPKEPYDGPEGFTPFAVGYVELPGQVIVESRLTRTDGLAVGMDVELAIVPFDDIRDTFAFQPLEPL